MKLHTPIFALLLSSWGFAHPADTSADGKISAQELASYATTSPSGNLLQQAENIFQLGNQGGYVSTIVGAETVYVPSNAAHRFVAMERYQAAPFSTVNLGALPPSNVPYIAYGSFPSNLAHYFPLSLTESSGIWSVAVPAFHQHFQNGTRINIYINGKGVSLDDPQRLDAGQILIAPVDTSQAAGSLQRFTQDLDSMVASLKTLTGINYADYFVNGRKSLSSVSNPFDKLEIALVCYLQDPKLEGGLRPTLALLDEFPDISAEVKVALDLLANGGAAQAQGVISQFNTQFTALVPSPNRSKAKSGKDFPANPSAQVLLDGMLDAEVARQMLDEPMFGPGAGAANTALGFAGLPGKIVSGSLGLTTAILQYRYSQIAFTNPSSAKLKAVFTKTTFYQDECDVTGSWTVTADASSKGWFADKATLDLVLSSVGALDVAADTVKVANALGKSGNVVQARNVLNEVESFNGRDVASAASQFGASESMKGLYDAAPNSNVIHIPKKNWTNIPFDHTTAQLSSNPAGLTTSLNTYVPNTVGNFTTLIKVKDGLYSVGVDSSEVVTISLVEAGARIQGCPMNYTPGAPYVLTAALERVANPLVGSFSWSAQWGDLTTPVVSNGVSTVIWTAPDPAPNTPVSITATSLNDLCLPPNTSAPVAFCVTQKGGDFVLEVNPAKGCYDLGDTVDLTFRNQSDPGDVVDTHFEIASGVGTLIKTSFNTATYTSGNSTSATILASVIASPTKFDSKTLNFGCAEFSMKVVQGNLETNPDNDPWTMTLTVGETDGVNFIVPGNVSDDGLTFNLEFTAATHRNSNLFADMQRSYDERVESYNIALDLYQNGGGSNPGRPPNEPRFGDVGVIFYDTVEEYEDRADDSPYNNSEFIHNDSSFNYSISFPYRREPGLFNVPGLFETNTLIFTAPPTITLAGGQPGAFQLDPVITVTELLVNGLTTYEVFFVPSSN